MRLLFITFILTTPYYAFSQVKNQSNKTWYDDWPTIPANANINGYNSDKSNLSPNYVLIGRSWDHRIITFFFQNGTPDIGGNAEEQAVLDAMEIWTNEADIVFMEVCNQADADISFLFDDFEHGDRIPACEPGLGTFDGVNGTLAHNMGGPDSGNNCGTQGGDVHFDESETWTNLIRINGQQPIDLVTVSAHELGHALGLFHTQVQGSLMLANYSGSHRFLGNDDIAGIQVLYDPQGTGNLISGSSTVCTTNSTFTLSTLPVGTSTSWSKSSNLSYVSGQGTAN